MSKDETSAWEVYLIIIVIVVISFLNVCSINFELKEIKTILQEQLYE